MGFTGDLIEETISASLTFATGDNNIVVTVSIKDVPNDPYEYEQVIEIIKKSYDKIMNRLSDEW